MHADVAEIKAEVLTYSYGVSIASDSDATSRLRVYVDSVLGIRTGAIVIGTERLEMIATFDGVDTNSDAHGVSDSGVGDTDTKAENNQSLGALIEAEGSASLMSEDLFVKVFVQVDRYRKHANSDGGFFDSGSEDVPGSQDTTRKITFDSDLIVLHPGPKLEVAEDGSILSQQGTVSNQITPSQVIINDLEGGQAAVRFEAESGEIDGSASTFNFSVTFGSVVIINHSSRDLVINNLDPVSSTIPIVTLIAPTINLTFDVTYSTQPTLVDVQNLSTSNQSDIIVNGVIDNPIGETRFTNTGGSVITGAAGLVRTNTLRFDVAHGDVGSTSSFFKAELVQSAGRPTHAFAIVGNNMFLDLTGILRDPAVVTFSPTLDSFNIGGDLSLRLRQAARETTVPLSGLPLTIEVVEPLVPQTTNVVTHFRPGPSDPPLGPLDLGLFGENPQPLDVTYTIGLLQVGGNISITGLPVTRLVHVTSGTDLLAGGHIDVTSNGDIALTESTGDLRVGLITSTGGNVTLTAAGSIVDAESDPASDINAFSIFLSALTGGIGSLLDELEINTSSLSSALLTATAAGAIAIRETQDDLKINHVASTGGSIQLTVNETGASGENLLVGVGKDIAATVGTVTLLVGDNIAIEGQVRAGTAIFIRGDYNNSDPGIGTIIHIPGTFTAPTAEISGQFDNDLVSLTNITPGTVTTVLLSSGNDVVYTGSNSRPVANAGGTLNNFRASLTLLGGTGADTWIADETGDTLPNTGTLTSTRLSGLGITGAGIAYLELEHFVLNLGSAGDTLTVSGAVANLLTEIHGDGGNDLITVTAPSVATAQLAIYGDAGADVINAATSSQPTTFYGGDQNDTITGGTADDFIYGQGGSDTLHGSGGNDWIEGDAPTDNPGAKDFIFGDAGDDILYGYGGDDEIHGGTGNDLVFGGAGDDLIFGDENNDHLLGEDGADTINGGIGDDVLVGGDGNDILHGDAGNDVLWGGIEVYSRSSFSRRKRIRRPRRDMRRPKSRRELHGSCRPSLTAHLSRANSPTAKTNFSAAMIPIGFLAAATRISWTAKTATTTWMPDRAATF